MEHRVIETHKKMKTCSKCKEDKELIYFNKRSESKDGYRNVCKKCMPKYKYDKPLDNGPMMCTTCKEVKPFDDFYKTVEKICKECQSIRTSAYRKTYNGIMREFLSAAKNRDAKSDLTLEFLCDLYEKQKGLCYYSQVKMTFDGAYKMSIERLDNDIGYLQSNVVFCCLEWNNQAKWTLEKVDEMLAILDKDIKDNSMNFDKKTTKVYKETPYDKRDYTDSPRGKLMELCRTAKHRAKDKTENGRDMEFELDFEFMVELFEKQKGLCAYSGLPLQFGKHVDVNWIISLERIDVYKGYTKDNVCYICLEFNSTDNSTRQKHKSETTTNWSKEKFQHIVKTIREAKLYKEVAHLSINNGN